VLPPNLSQKNEARLKDKKKAARTEMLAEQGGEANEATKTLTGKAKKGKMVLKSCLAEERVLNPAGEGSDIRNVKNGW